jgi:DNA mismatch endonuclease (patch repair protein)
MDIVDSATRSRMMAGIGAKNSRPELVVRRFLHGMGFRYRLHQKGLPGSPDLVLSKYRVSIFVHGCFWHRHLNCTFSTNPATNSLRWSEKFRVNVARDKRNINDLLAAGWRVVVLWECGLRGSDPKAQLDWLPKAIRSGGFSSLEWPEP